MILRSILEEEEKQPRYMWSTCMSLHKGDQNFYGVVTSGHLGILLNCLNSDMHLICPCLKWILLYHFYHTKSIFLVYNFVTVLN